MAWHADISLNRPAGVQAPAATSPGYAGGTMTNRAVYITGVLAAALGGCSTLAPAAFEGDGPEMRPEAFFAGATVSSGVLENRSGEPTKRFHVEGQGVLRPDGALRLVQTVTFDKDPPTIRTWELRQLDAHRYEATLTDAAGPVAAEAYGNVFHLTYSMRSPPLGRMEQWMYLQPDGHTLVNEATVSLLGIDVARLSERITHVDGPAADAVPH